MLNENKVLFVQYQSYQPVKIQTHQLIIGTGESVQMLSDVADVIGAYRSGSLLADTPIELLSLHAVVDGVEYILPGNMLLSLIPTASCSFDNPLIIKSHKDLTALAIKSKSDMDVDDSHVSSPPKRSPSDDFIADNKLNLHKLDDVFTFLRLQIEYRAPYNPERPYQATFADNCLEHRLDRRQTTYQLDEVDNVKILLHVSGAGKTRQLLEMLWMKFGYYFVTQSHQLDFGSGDLIRCYACSVKTPDKVDFFIGLLYLVRAFVCNYVYDLGYNQPWQILLAQLHPVQFFGCDIFKLLFESLAEGSKTTSIGSTIERCFDFVAIDEIQMIVESSFVFSLPNSENARPFYSPLVFYTKHLGKFPNFIVSGTGINYIAIDELMASGTMKAKQFTSHSTISNIQPLDKDAIDAYSRRILSDHNIDAAEIEKFVALVCSFKLCHGRARFIAYILDSFLASRDMEVAISQFVSGLSNIDGGLFPLRFFRRDLAEQKTSFTKVFGGDTLGRIVRDGIVEYMMTGKAILLVKGQLASDAVRWGLGFCNIEEGVIYAIEMVEDAIVECLRYLVPFSDVVETLASQLLRYPKPEMVGLMLEYLVAYALVANLHPGSVNQIKTFTGSMVEYLKSSTAQYQVFFPDHCCGPDILFKDGNTLYIIQVKFVDKISKQERVHACSTTDPQYFYWNRNKGSVLKGFETRRGKILAELKNMSRTRVVFLHTTTKTVAVWLEANPLLWLCRWTWFWSYTLKCTGCSRDAHFKAICTHYYCTRCIRSICTLASHDRTLFPAKCCKQEFPQEIIVRVLDPIDLNRYILFQKNLTFENIEGLDASYRRMVVRKGYVLRSSRDTKPEPVDPHALGPCLGCCETASQRVSCGHAFCTACIKRACVLAVRDRAQFPAHRCGKEFPQEAVQLALEAKDMQTYVAYQKDLTIANIAGLDPEFRRMVRQNGWSLCGKCGAGIERIGGCNSVRCVICGNVGTVVAG
ncbi:hypothetical protein BJ741DRAFT_714983 [Chytriomyces cf. hyalinus JEL632]|nr:hypothetical protein BJ741DRAFT_714983 [Chytriomyces cf. hyalinus JEL632]